MKHSSLYRGNSMRQQIFFFFFFSTQIFRSLTNTVDILPPFFSILLHYHTFFGSDFIVDLKRLENKLSPFSSFFLLFLFFLFFIEFSPPIPGFDQPSHRLGPVQDWKMQIVEARSWDKLVFPRCKDAFLSTGLPLSIHPSPISSSITIPHFLDLDGPPQF